MKRTPLLAAVLAAILVMGCDPPTGAVHRQRDGVRALPADFGTRKAVAYSGFRLATNHDADAPSQDDIDEDLTLLNSKGYNLLRLFTSSDAFSKKVLERIVAKEFDMKVQLGVWIDGSKAAHGAANDAEIERSVALANTFKDIVVAVSVGNEKMVEWNTSGPAPIADMAVYIEAVRSRISQPVTTDENWAVWANDGNKYATVTSIYSAVDYITVHTYPIADTPYGLWNWKQVDVEESLRATAMMDAAIQKAKDDYAAAKTFATNHGYGALPIVVGETGWKSTDTVWTHRAHPVNQKMYADRLAAWSEPTQIFDFEAFDEPWKGGDDNWGLWDVNRDEKYVLSGTGYTAADAEYYVPPVPNGTITKNEYFVFADTLTADADTAIPTEAQQWGLWDGNTGTVATATAGTGQEGTDYAAITPVPKAWGWGVFLYGSSTYSDDLTGFNQGHLRFLVKTTYAGKVEIGFFTSDDTGKVDVYTAVDPANNTYGYANDGEWHEVSIPIATLLTKAAPAYAEPSTATVNLQFVANPFVIADRYANTSKSQNANIKTVINVDKIRWTRD